MKTENDMLNEDSFTSAVRQRLEEMFNGTNLEFLKLLQHRMEKASEEFKEAAAEIGARLKEPKDKDNGKHTGSSKQD